MSEDEDRNTQSEFPTQTGPSSDRQVSSSTTVRCEFPEEAAATLRIAEGERVAVDLAIDSPRFEDRGPIARGGMSSVRKVFDKVILRNVAMKVLEARHDFNEVSRFIEEAQITGQLDHPNIVPIYDVETDANRLPTRFTMKLVEGRTLHDILNNDDDDDDGSSAAEFLERQLQIFIKICDAVAFAHSRGVIHRDLKPGNIMVGSHGQVYVMDWGIALLREGERPSEQVKLGRTDNPEAEGSLSGTPSYMAPEQALGRVNAIDERTDVYGLGGILYHVLCRQPPHFGHNVEEDLMLARNGIVPYPTDVISDRELPPGLCRIAMRALESDPEERYATVEELKQDVESSLRGGGWFGTRHVPKGEIILREGDTPDAAYIIKEGQCELYRMVDGEKHFMRLMGAGEVFGETSIFGSTRRTANVAASSDVTLIVVTRDALERELDRSVWLRTFVEAVTERFLEVDAKLARLDRERDT